jgi:hypothetical protein
VLEDAALRAYVVCREFRLGTVDDVEIAARKTAR